MPNIGNFVWVFLPILILIAWWLPHAVKWAFLYAGIMSLISVFVPGWHLLFHPPELDPGRLIPMLRGESIVFFCLMLTFMLLLQCRLPRVTRLIEALGWITFGILLFFGGASEFVPIFTNPSLAAVTVILCLGFTKKHNLLAGLGAALLTFSRSGFLAWGVGMILTYWEIWFKSQKQVRIPVWIGTFAALAVGVWYVGHEDAQRGLMLSRFWDLYRHADYPTVLFGMGPGTFGTWYEPWQALQLAHGVQLVEQFHHIHNDFLEIFADFGIFGSLLITASTVWFLWRIEFELFVKFTVLASVMLIYFPLHYPPTLVLTFVFLKQAWDARGVQKTNDHSPGTEVVDSFLVPSTGIRAIVQRMTRRLGSLLFLKPEERNEKGSVERPRSV